MGWGQSYAAIQNVLKKSIGNFHRNFTSGQVRKGEAQKSLESKVMQPFKMCPKNQLATFTVISLWEKASLGVLVTEILTQYTGLL